jgi:hypothetical protein
LSSEDTLFFIGFPNRDLLELFMMHFGEEFKELGGCLFISGTCQDRDMVKRYWIIPIEAGRLLTIRDYLNSINTNI